MMIKVGARSSNLSRKQVEEVLALVRQIRPEIQFDCHFVLATGDRDLKTSLRTLDKTDFFTREVDELLLNETIQIAIHSAKDLPDPIDPGLAIIALTQGVDASDVLVMRPGVRFEDLAPGSRIGTSSTNREKNLLSLRADLLCLDIRGTIESRLEQLDRGEYDGVIMAKAALIRLGLEERNAFPLPGETTPLQGRLAILARIKDEEMRALFSPLDYKP